MGSTATPSTPKAASTSTPKTPGTPSTPGSPVKTEIPTKLGCGVEWWRKVLLISK